VVHHLQILEESSGETNRVFQGANATQLRMKPRLFNVHFQPRFAVSVNDHVTVVQGITIAFNEFHNTMSARACTWLRR